MGKPTGPAKGDLPCSNRGCALGHHHTPLAGHPIMRSTGTIISSNHWRGNSATSDNTRRRSSQYSRIPTLGRAPSATHGQYRINGTLLPNNACCHAQPSLRDGPQTPADMANKRPGRRQEENQGNSTGRKGDQPNERSAG